MAKPALTDGQACAYRALILLADASKINAVDRTFMGSAQLAETESRSVPGVSLLAAS